MGGMMMMDRPQEDEIFWKGGSKKGWRDNEGVSGQRREDGAETSRHVGGKMEGWMDGGMDKWMDDGWRHSDGRREEVDLWMDG